MSSPPHQRTPDSQGLQIQSDLDCGVNWKTRFWMIFVGQACAFLGSALTNFVLLWWITYTTQSVSALATAGTATWLPQAFLSPFGGTFADRYSRRLLMIGSDLVSTLGMLVVVILFLTRRIELWHVYTMIFIRSAMQVFHAPAAAASITMLVPSHFLSRAAGLEQTLQGLTTVAAAPFGALAMSFMPLGWALTIDLIAAVIGILPLLIFQIPQMGLGMRDPSGLWIEFWEGFNLVWREHGLRNLYVLIGSIVLIITPSVTLLPLLVKQYFHGGAPQVALMECLGGAGMIAGGLVAAVVAPQRHVPWIFFGFGSSCLAVALTALSPANLLGVAVACWVISGIAFMLGNASITSLLRLQIPNNFQGRALSLMSTVLGLAAFAGLVAAIPVGEFLGVRWLFVSMGLLGTLVSSAGFLSPRLLDLNEHN
jgi:MFS transporter, DHA3 family, macrolide efflux protein